MPFRDPYPGSTESDQTPRRFQELELPDPYAWFMSTAYLNFGGGVAEQVVTWTALSTVFPPTGFNPTVTTADPVIPTGALYAVQYISQFRSGTTGLFSVAVSAYRLPFNSTTPQQVAFKAYGFETHTAGLLHTIEANAVVPLVDRDRVLIGVSGSTPTTDSTSLHTTGQQQLTLAGLGQMRKEL